MDYLRLTESTNKLVEFSDGTVEVLPMPTREHQLVVGWLYRKLLEHLGGIVLFAPLRLKLRDGRFREPDLLFLKDRQDPRNQSRFWTGADLVIEVLSTDDPDRDLVEKRREYAAAGIPEYWIADPTDRTLLVLHLEGATYRDAAPLRGLERVRSELLPELSFAAADVFADLD